MDDSEDEIRESNEAFYRAFRERNTEAMESIWARGRPVACLHPGMAPLVGRDEVLESWREILNNEEAPRIVCTKVSIHVLGNVAYVTCLEGSAGSPPALAATNLFAREDGLWRLVHHQAGPLASRGGHQPLDEPAESQTIN